MSVSGSSFLMPRSPSAPAYAIGGTCPPLPLPLSLIHLLPHFPHPFPPLTILHRTLHASSCADEDFVVFVFTAALLLLRLLLLLLLLFLFLLLSLCQAASGEQRAAHLLV